MEGKSRRSFSLQDLRTISAPADLEACTTTSSDVPRSAWNFSRASRAALGSFSKGNQAAPQSISRVALAAALLVLVVLLLYLGFLWGRSLWSRDEQMRFAIIMDCGSTSTRVYVYGWVYNDRSIPVMYRPPSHTDTAQIAGASKQKAYHRMETEPGFHHLLHNETGLRAAVKPLLDWAKKQVPLRSQAETPLYLLGTAGLRKMAKLDSEWLLDKAWKIIEKSPFRCRRSWLRIISGEEEAYYGWAALNYVLERLGGSARLPTVGSLDLGGSSLEVTFEPHYPIRKGYGYNLTIGREQHQLYAYSHSGFGLNDAFDKSVALLMQKGGNMTLSDGTLLLKHPCLHSEYRQPYACSSYCVAPPVTREMDGGDGAVHMELMGEPNWEQCQALARSVVNASPPSSQCKQTPSTCALGKYQPEPRGQFSAVAGFFVMYKFFGLSSKASLDDLLQRGKEFCAKPWPAARASVKPQDFIDRYCFRTPYVVSLLRDGLHLRDEQITVGPGDITWTQGAALIEAGRSKFKSSSTRGVLDASTATVLVLVLLLLILVSVSWYHRWRHQFLPFDTKPSSGNGTLRWLRNLRGVKSPQSPAPSTAPSRHEQQPSRALHLEASVPLLIEPEMLRLPPPGPGASSRAQHHSTAKIQLKGGSRLQSRRTPSKEDLNTL